ncbi:MAG TPA: hypothetical protein VM434_07930 [Beijerinckiaceae bacterium]|nr:hypothetical protein [Beijerinckiaceae bacterium]
MRRRDDSFREDEDGDLAVLETSIRLAVLLASKRGLRDVEDELRRALLRLRMAAPAADDENLRRFAELARPVAH